MSLVGCEVEIIGFGLGFIDIKEIDGEKYIRTYGRLFGKQGKVYHHDLLKNILHVMINGMVLEIKREDVVRIWP